MARTGLEKEVADIVASSIVSSPGARGGEIG